jgi:hypothetical protein
MADWRDPVTFWLNLMNALLGVATILPLVLVAVVAVVEVVTRRRHRLSAGESGGV